MSSKQIKKLGKFDIFLFFYTEKKTINETVIICCTYTLVSGFRKNGWQNEIWRNFFLHLSRPVVMDGQGDFVNETLGFYFYFCAVHAKISIYYK